MPTLSFQDLARKEGITLELLPGSDEPPPPGMERHTAWTTTLRYDWRKLTVPYFTPPPPHGSTPDPTQVLFMLCYEAKLYKSTFETWATALRFNPDSRAAYRLWENIGKMVPKLAKFLDRKGQAFLDLVDVSGQTMPYHFEG